MTLRIPVALTLAIGLLTIAVQGSPSPLRPATTASVTAVTRWGIAGADFGGTATEIIVGITNLADLPGSITLTLLFDDGGTTSGTMALAAAGRTHINIGEAFPSAAGRRFGIIVESQGVPAAPILVDWTRRSLESGTEWFAATPLTGYPLAATDGSGALSVPSAAVSEPQSFSRSTLQAANEGTGPATPAAVTPGAAVYNLSVVSDASPDLTDLPRFVRSTTSLWPSNQEKVWALFYWTHLLKRQTAPMMLHGLEVTDPIRNFTDYGFTMCSTITGINQSLYERLGLRHQYWDLCNHTVSAVEYDNAFRMVDSSMSNLVTTDDGRTLATVSEAAADGARLVRERSLYITSPNGFLTGSDAMRNLPDIVSPADASTVAGYAANFCATGLKLRDYYYNWDTGHRYVLNLRPDESYTRYYRPLGTTADYFVASEKIASPNPAQTTEIDSANRFGLRGNGTWSFTPQLTAEAWTQAIYSSTNVTASDAGGLRPGTPGQPADVIYKVQAANAITSQLIQAQFARTDALATAAIAISLNHGATWTDVAAAGATGEWLPVTASLRAQVNGAYEVLVRIRMRSDDATPDGVRLSALTITTITQVNIKALPVLNVGRNEMFLTLGDQSDTMVLWPDLRADFWKNDIYDSTNIASQPVSVPRKYTAVAYPATLTKDAYLTYRMESPTDITRAIYGGRLHNYRAGSHIDFLHSFDGGATWIRSYRLTDVSKPYDVIHYETLTNLPPGTRTILFKFAIHNTNSEVTRATGFYALRMEVNHQPLRVTPAPVDVTLHWKEVRADRTTVARSHTQRVDAYPFKYVVNVGGSDHPVMESLTMKAADPAEAVASGYGDGVDAGGDKYVPIRQTDGTNLAKGAPYTFSRAPSGFQSSAPASNTTLLTDGVVGAPATGSYSYWAAQCWSANQMVDFSVDLRDIRSVGVFRAHLQGSPGWDALKGQVQDRVEILTSTDGISYTSQGLLQTSLWRKDIPVNYMLPDDEKATAWNFALALPTPVEARYVRYHVTPKRILCASELQVLDRVTREPFPLRIAPPEGFGVVAPPVPVNLAPSIDLVSPLADAAFVAPASVALTADARDPDDGVARVEFFADGVLIGEAAAPPYSASWNDASPGAHTLTARATDVSGQATMSAAVTVTIDPPLPPGNVPPRITMTAPAGGTRLVMPATVTVTATAADADDGVVRVEFLVGGETIGTATAAPYETVWTAAAPGEYTLTATATDASGAIATTPPVVITIAEEGSVLVPDVTGLTEAAAGPWMATAALTVGAVTYANSPTVAAGAVISQSPAAGASAAPGTAVAIVVSLGPAPVIVPSVVGLSATAAAAQISASGLAVGAASSANSAATAGAVISQSPAAGTSAAPGSPVALTVSLGPPMVTVPAVVGLSEAAAAAQITGTGLMVGTGSSANSGSVAAGTVISQSPAAGVSAVPGSAVTLVVSLGPAAGDPLQPWTATDIGAVGLSGSSSFDSATARYSVTGAGADVWGSADAVHYMYRLLTGDGEIVARVASVQNTTAWVKAGVMIRASTAPGSAQAMMMVTPGKGNNYQRRPTTGSASAGTAGTMATAPYWVKLTRLGSMLTASESPDGVNWSVVGTAQITLPATVLVGLAVSSHSTAMRATATFDQVSLTPFADVTPPAVTIAPAGGTYSAAVTVTLTASEPATIRYTIDGSVPTEASPIYTAPIAITATAMLRYRAVDVAGNPSSGTASYTIALPPIAVPAPWAAQDIGAVGVAGTASFSPTSQTYTVAGAGADIWGTADAFRFVYQPLVGDGEIVARVATVATSNAWVKAGVMIRAGLSAGAAQAMMMVTPGKGNNFQRRPTDGGASVGTAGSVVTAPEWVRLTRAGSTITAYESADGITWSPVGSATITGAETMLVGLAVSSHSATKVAAATFDQVSVTSTGTTAQP